MTDDIPTYRLYILYYTVFSLVVPYSAPTLLVFGGYTSVSGEGLMVG